MDICPIQRQEVAPHRAPVARQASNAAASAQPDNQTDLTQKLSGIIPIEGEAVLHSHDELQLHSSQETPVLLSNYTDLLMMSEANDELKPVASASHEEVTSTSRQQPLLPHATVTQLYVTPAALPVLYSVTAKEGPRSIEIAPVLPLVSSKGLEDLISGPAASCIDMAGTDVPSASEESHAEGSLSSNALSARARRLTQMYRCLHGSSPLPFLTRITPRHDVQNDVAGTFRVQPPRVLASSKPQSSASPSSSAATSRLQFLKVTCIELLLQCDPGKCPDSSKDEVLVACIADTSTVSDVCSVTFFAQRKGIPRALCVPAGHLHRFNSEGELLSSVLAHLFRIDSDVVVSWDAQKGGLGYVFDRCRLTLQVDPEQQLSRFRSTSTLNAAANSGAQPLPGTSVDRNSDNNDGGIAAGNASDGNESQDSDIAQTVEGNTGVTPLFPRVIRNASRRPGNVLRISGRVILSLWKVFRSELKLKSYSLQSVYHALFKTQMPYFADSDLSSWYLSQDAGSHALAYSALQFLARKTIYPIQVCRKLDLFVRTSEMASLYGIQFFEVLSRGSQYRVESALRRFTKPMNLVCPSPSREQVMQQNRQEGIPLVMEPISGYRREPVLVLDFRSLYPSVIIAYNICFSTCLGKISESRRKKLGAIAGFTLPPSFVNEHIQSINVAPNSVMFVRPEVREGVLPKMLRCMLNTRFEVQALMKEAKSFGEEALRRLLDAQQLAIKMLANVTYGYTAATFTGRMPCSDIADSIVLLGRQTLEAAIRTIETNTAWQAKVVYGDTDSLFVHLPHADKAAAFDIADEIIRAINASNPAPITIKLEKVYAPCFMIVKKRYVGYAWESRTQSQPKFDAKGIETIRRDQCDATSRICEEMLRILFETNDKAALRNYFYEECSKIQRGDVEPNQLILRREVRLGSYVRDSTLPPGARVALRMMAEDAGSTPLYGERVPYVVVNTTSAKLRDMVIHPAKLLQLQRSQDTIVSINAQYYLEKHIVASLHRMFHLVGVDFSKWLRQMPRMRRRDAMLDVAPRRTPHAVQGERSDRLVGNPTEGQQQQHFASNATLDSFCSVNLCAVCAKKSRATQRGDPPVCNECLANYPDSLLRIQVRRHRIATAQHRLFEICHRCCQGSPPPVSCHNCTSLECPVVFRKVRNEALLCQYGTLDSFLARFSNSHLKLHLSRTLEW